MLTEITQELAQWCLTNNNSETVTLYNRKHREDWTLKRVWLKKNSKIKQNINVEEQSRSSSPNTDTSMFISPFELPRVNYIRHSPLLFLVKFLSSNRKHSFSIKHLYLHSSISIWLNDTTFHVYTFQQLIFFCSNFQTLISTKARLNTNTILVFQHCFWCFLTIQQCDITTDHLKHKKE